MPGNVSLLSGLLAAVAITLPAAAQEVGAGARADALGVYLDCRTHGCDGRYFRTEITFVNWVQEPQDADVHLILTRQELGGGGTEWILDFLGRSGLEGEDDRLRHQTDRTDTDEEVLRALTRVTAAGLARYAALAGLAPGLDITLSTSGADVPTLPPGLQGEVDDPWDYWVFSVRLNGDLSGEEQQSSRSAFTRLGANRVTREWKLDFDLSMNFRESEFELDDSTFVSTTRNWNSRGLVAYSLADRWSLAADLTMGASTFVNQDFRVGLRTGVEYSFYPYEEATRKALTVVWLAGASYVDYEEETLFGKMEEQLWEEALMVELDLRQPWGGARLFGQASHYFHDFSLNRISLGGGMSFRIFRGLSWNVNGRVARIRDQIFLSGAGVPDEEVLVRRRALATDFEYRISMGVTISFGSIYNNVVNNRFD